MKKVSPKATRLRPLPFSKIRGSDKERTYACLREWIIYSELKPSEKLNERKLAEDFGISRTPLREVLQFLSYQGLVVIQPRSGIIVAPIDTEQLRMVFETRLPLEREVARLAALHATDAQLTSLEKIAVESKAAYEAEDIEQVIRQDDKFHTRLAQISNNSVLFHARESLHNICLRYWFLIREEYFADLWDYDAHLRLVKALQSRNANFAASLHEEHVNSFVKLLEEKK